jgi:hypothetical protein
MLPRLVFDSNSHNDDDIDPAIRADLAAFDAAPDPQKIDLSAFDKADPRSVLPVGWYSCTIASGELGTTRAGKLCYKLRFTVIEPPEFMGRALFKTVMLHDAAAQARARMLLTPLGLTSAEALRRPFPPPGKAIFVKTLVTIQPERNGYPESNSVERFTPCDRPAEATPGASTCPFAVPLDGAEEGGGA